MQYFTISAASVHHLRLSVFLNLFLHFHLGLSSLLPFRLLFSNGDICFYFYLLIIHLARKLSHCSSGLTSLVSANSLSLLSEVNALFVEALEKPIFVADLYFLIVHLLKFSILTA